MSRDASTHRLPPLAARREGRALHQIRAGNRPSTRTGRPEGRPRAAWSVSDRDRGSETWESALKASNIVARVSRLFASNSANLLRICTKYGAHSAELPVRLCSSNPQGLVRLGVDGSVEVQKKLPHSWRRRRQSQPVVSSAPFSTAKWPGAVESTAIWLRHARNGFRRWHGDIA
jgi:hypothetical protein